MERHKKGTADIQSFTAIGEHVSGATRILEKRRQMLEVKKGIGIEFR